MESSLSDKHANFVASKAENASWHNLEPQEVAQLLNTDLVCGLSEAEANLRLKQYGSNTLEHVQRARWLKVFVR